MENKQEITTTFETIKDLVEKPLTTELIISDDFSQKYEQLASASAYFDEMKKTIDNKIKETLEQNYFETGESSVQSGDRKFIYIAETTRESFNSKDFKKDNPELYKKYVKVSKVASSLRSLVEKEKDGE